ncbi:MAG: ABC transporter permease [Ignavibacteriales bacterium]|jgi:putative ABC transport system permease protein|nr:ABC transporter permease [Ignavibacteriales bacterium]MBK8662329.1 ABC transporter permease [Ignavibacteriales bacterium]MBP9123391.1 ABC transporter permease [Ignavibacteriaceae bacterium]
MIPLKYTINSLKRRKLTTAITIVGVSLVAFVFTAVLMMAYGIEKTLQDTGSPDNIKVVRKSATGEISSLIDGDAQSIIATSNMIVKSKEGKPLVSNEPVVLINLTSEEGGTGNLMVRGVNETYKELRPQVKIVDGREFRFGVNELIVGEGLFKKFPDAALGKKIKFAGGDWLVVGVFSTDGSGFDSELWGDAKQILSSFNRGNTVSTMTIKLGSADQLDQFNKFLMKDTRLNMFEAKAEQQYYAEQSEAMSMFISIVGIFVTVIFSFGATIGATITMYSAVANRTVEIGTLRALGFSRRSILSAFLIESLFLSMLGGLLGLLLASSLSFVQISTLNFSSFSEIAFKFSLSPQIIISSLIFALFMGFIGGFLPSIRAARLNIVNALRGM